MYRRPNDHNPVSYEWLNAKKKNFDKELARIQASGAVYRLVYRDPYLGNQLVFERQTNSQTRSSEYRALKLSFKLLGPPIQKGIRDPNARVDLTPESKENVKLINDLARQGFVVRDLFMPELNSKSVSVLLERSSDTSQRKD